MYIVKSIVLASVALIDPKNIWGGLEQESFGTEGKAETKIDQACVGVTSKIVSVQSEDGICQAIWSCDQSTFKVLCMQNYCECFVGNEVKPYHTINFESCSTIKLESCFAL